jgi:molybdopterin-guanine dinucleotide biosynthesis protein A
VTPGDEHSARAAGATSRAMELVAASSSRERVVGGLLCGGRSRRMGVDKALLINEGGRTLLEAAAARLEAVAGEVLLSVGPTPRYEGLLRPGWRLVADAFVGPDLDGPLVGLASLLEAAEGATLVTLPVDMPGVEPALLRSLLVRRRSSGADVVLARGPRGVEPLIGAFGPAAATAARDALAAGERRPLCLLERLRVEQLEVPTPGDLDPLRNLNRPEDWALEQSQVGPGERRGGAA